MAHIPADGSTVNRATLQESAHCQRSRMGAALKALTAAGILLQSGSGKPGTGGYGYALAAPSRKSVPEPASGIPTRTLSARGPHDTPARPWDGRPIPSGWLIAPTSA